ncbi:TonB-dependent receptor [Polymorphobacter sp.]|uniref:TonB-dependent receptor n=1 Tax=Polymorphobacter sp. TaxID=1909290 RepID=UPI003F7073AC
MKQASATTAASLLTLMMASSALAQTPSTQSALADADAALPGEIIVTARRQSERLQDVPVAVTAVSADLLRQTAATGLADVAKYTAGFTFENGVGILNSPVIRGQAQSRIGNPVQNVATFFNGIYIQRGFMVDNDLLDLERIEIIKGPQAALYGRNAFSGAISFVTAQPSLTDIRARAEVTLGTDERRDYKVSISVPIIKDRLAVSAGYVNTRFDGTWENAHPLANAGLATNGNLGGYKNESWLIQATARPLDTVRIDGFYFRREAYQEALPAYRMAPSGTLVSQFSQMNCDRFEASAPAARGQFASYCGAFTAAPQTVAGELLPNNVHLVDPRAFSLNGTSTIYSGTVTIEAGDVLEFIYQYGRVEGESIAIGQLSRDAVRGTPLLTGNFAPFAGRLLLDQRGGGGITADSHEMRVNWTASDRLSGKVGGFYSSTRDFDVGGSLAAFPNNPNDFILTNFPAGELFPPGLSATLREDKSFAIFGAFDAFLSETLRLSAEGRYTFEDRREQAKTFPAFTPAGAQLSRSFKYFTPRVALDWKVSPDQLVYASVARGVKSGGFNGRAISPTVLTYEPETNWTYEIGAKTQWLDRRLTLNVSAYHVDWQQLQFNFQDPGGTIGTAAVLGNIKGAKVWGFEVEVNAQVTPELNLSIGGAWNDTKFVDGTFDLEIPRANCQPATLSAGTCPYNGDISGNRLARSPAGQLFGAITYARELSRDLRTTARVSGSWQGKSFVDNRNNSWMPSRTIVDASLALEHRNVSLRVWARNLLDNKYASFATTTYASSGGGSGASYGVIAGERRTIGVTAALNY